MNSSTSESLDRKLSAIRLARVRRTNPLADTWDWILPGRLAQGGAVTRAPSERFDVIVLAAVEHQPRSHELDLPTGTRLLHCPFDDTREPTEKDILTAIGAARLVAQALLQGEKVLSSCQAGWNRSGLVTASALLLVGNEKGTPLSAKEVIARIRKSRDSNALGNTSFVRAVHALERRLRAKGR